MWKPRFNRKTLYTSMVVGYVLLAAVAYVSHRRFQSRLSEIGSSIPVAEQSIERFEAESKIYLREAEAEMKQFREEYKRQNQEYINQLNQVAEDYLEQMQKQDEEFRKDMAERMKEVDKLNERIQDVGDAVRDLNKKVDGLEQRVGPGDPIL